MRTRTAIEIITPILMTTTASYLPAARPTLGQSIPKAYTYDLFGRVQKEMTTAEAAGKRASAMVQYRYQNGELVEMKDDKGVTLWKLSSENPYGQPLISHKGNVKETYTYDKGFPVSQLLQSEDKAIGALTWQFNLQKRTVRQPSIQFLG